MATDGNFQLPARYLPYTASGEMDVWDALKIVDGDGSGGVRLLYSGYCVPAGERDKEYESGAGWTREHLWPRSHTGGGFDVRRPGPGTDLHCIYPADPSVNSARCERDFDEGGAAFVDGTPAPGRSGDTGCRSGDGTWEPPDEAKGRVARAVMYTACAYGGALGIRLVDRKTRRGERALGRLSVLLEWARRFPPTDEERSRNDAVERLQGNRNPFVDDPGLADRVRWEV